MTTPFYIRNDNVLEVMGLSFVDGNGVTVYLGAGDTVQVAVRDRQGNEIAGETWPLALDYVAGSSGDFTKTLVKAINVVEGGHYEAVIEAQAGAGPCGEWVLPGGQRKKGLMEIPLGWPIEATGQRSMAGSGSQMVHAAA